MKIKETSAYSFDNVEAFSPIQKFLFEWIYIDKVTKILHFKLLSKQNIVEKLLWFYEIVSYGLTNQTEMHPNFC